MDPTSPRPSGPIRLRPGCPAPCPRRTGGRGGCGTNRGFRLGGLLATAGSGACVPPFGGAACAGGPPPLRGASEPGTACRWRAVPLSRPAGARDGGRRAGGRTRPSEQEGRVDRTLPRCPLANRLGRGADLRGGGNAVASTASTRGPARRPGQGARGCPCERDPDVPLAAVPRRSPPVTTRPLSARDGERSRDDAFGQRHPEVHRALGLVGRSPRGSALRLPHRGGRPEARMGPPALRRRPEPPQPAFCGRNGPYPRGLTLASAPSARAPRGPAQPPALIEKSLREIITEPPRPGPRYLEMLGAT